MDVLFPQEEKELNVLVNSEYDKDIFKQTIVKYPVIWDTIREMLMHGWSANQIKAFCNETYIKGRIISDVWNAIKCIDTIRP